MVDRTASRSPCPAVSRLDKPWSTLALVGAAALATYFTPTLSGLRPISAAAAATTWRAVRSFAPAVRAGWA